MYVYVTQTYFATDKRNPIAYLDFAVDKRNPSDFASDKCNPSAILDFAVDKSNLSVLYSHPTELTCR